MTVYMLTAMRGMYVRIPSLFSFLKDLFEEKNILIFPCPMTSILNIVRLILKQKPLILKLKQFGVDKFWFHVKR